MRPRARRVALTVGTAVLLLAVAGAAAVGVHYSNSILKPGGPPTLREQRVLEVAPDRVRLSRDAESLEAGTWALEWEDGFGWVGPVLESDSASVLRSFRGVRGRLAAGGWASLRGVPRAADPLSMLGLRYETVTVEGPLGSCPAWLVPGEDSTWVIYVHGRGATRAEALRSLSVLATRGLPGLLVTYRNDQGAPRSRDGFDHLGLSEWEDVEAAVRYALAHGARDLVLVGCSMGGQVVGQFLERSALAPRVRGVVLESPLLDWDATLALRARILGVPAAATWLGERVATLRAGIDWDRLDLVAHPPGGAAPILLFHSRRDTWAPVSSSEAFARRLGARVTLVTLDTGNHVNAWNTEPERYARVVHAWCTAHGIGRAAR